MSSSSLPAQTASSGQGLARSASILGLGSIASRVLGLARETIVSGYFGASGQLSAFNLAARVPNAIYDLLVGGMLSAALVPVFSDYARPERRHELAQVASAVLSLIAVIVGSVVVLLELFAEPIAGILGNFPDPALQRVLADSLRIIAPASLIFGLSGGVTGLLYALKRFTYTALGGAVFNLGIVLAAPLLAPRAGIGIAALPIGVVAGSLMQLAVMLPGLRGIGLRLSLAWEHPAVRRIFRLYIPIAFGLVITNIQTIVDGRWASATGAQSVSWMRYATTLREMPLGLVPVAVSLAALPTLSQRAATGDWEGFRALFARGLRLVLVLLVPAMVGLWVLAGPIIRLLFQHGNFLPADTAMTAVALRLYLIGMLFAGVDFLLNYSFYARQDTLTPAVVGVIAVGSYFVAAILLRPQMGFRGLVLADSIKQATHAGIMTFVLMHSVGRLSGHRIVQTAAKCAAAAVLMGIAVWLLALAMGTWLPATFAGTLALVTIPAAAGGMCYVAILQALGVPEAGEVVAWAQRRLRTRKASTGARGDA